MEKLDKKKVLAVVLIIALIASLVSTVSLLYNSIDMFLHNIAGGVKYARYQQPYSIIMLFAFVVAALGTGVGIASFIVKKDSAKKLCLILALCAAGALFVLMVAAVGVNFANEAKYASSIKYPNDDYNDRYYAIYSSVMAVLIPQLVYCAIIAAVLLTVYLMDKNAATKAVEANDINSENKGE